MPNSARFCIVSAALIIVAATTHQAEAASLYIAPSPVSAQADSSFSVGLFVSSPDQAMNAAGLTLRFPNELLQVTNISKSNSIFNLWVQDPSYSNKDGTVSFEGIVLNPGYIGSSGRMLTITFRARNPGTGSLKFSQGQVLANDGDGTSITNSLGSANITITTPATPAAVVRVDAPVIRSASHPSPDTWYSLSEGKFAWEMPSDADAATWVIGTSLAAPSVGSFEQGAHDTTVSLSSFPDGTHYFSLRIRVKGQWSATGRYKFNVDRIAPEAFEVSAHQENPTDPQPQISFSTKDDTSGISGYQIKVDENEWQDSGVLKFGPNYRLPVLSPGPHVVVVRAVDRAGNFTDAQVTINISPIAAPAITDFTTTLNSVKDMVRLRGEAPTSTTVLLSGVSGLQTVSFAAKTDEQGKFIYENAGLPSAGKWIFTAIAKDGRGATSEQSAPVTINVRESLLEFLKNAVQWWGVLIILLIALLAATFLVRWAFVKSRLVILAKKQEILERQRDMLKKLEEMSSEAREAVLSAAVGVGEERKEAIKEQIGEIKIEARELEKELKEEYREQAQAMEKLPEGHTEEATNPSSPNVTDQNSTT